MTDILNGAQKALFVRLSAQITGVSVVEHPEQNKPAPFVMLENIASEPAAGKTGGLDRLSITVAVEAKARGRKACQALAASVRTALEGWAGATVDGVILDAPTFQSADFFRLDEADRYFGQVRFLAFAQPA